MSALQCGRALSDRHNGCAHTFEDWDEIDAAQPFRRKIVPFVRLKWHHWIKNPWDASVGSVIRLVQRRLRLLVHGYDPNEWWMHHVAASRVAYRHLQTMHDKGHGISPCGDPHIQGVSLDGSGRDEWKAMLADMIVFHQIEAHEHEPRTTTFICGCGRHKGEVHSYADSPEFDELTPEEQRRYRRGKWLYFKYYEHLWD